MLVRHMSPQLKNESTVVGEAKNTFTKTGRGSRHAYVQTNRHPSIPFAAPDAHLLHLTPKHLVR